jgi:dTDP-4-amino-4,6-dideoxygalactose transaminase
MEMNKKILLASPHLCGKERDYVTNAFDTNWVAPLGPHVDEFEKEIAHYVGKKHAAALSSGTAAIHMALKAVGVEENDIIFCSDLTFAATCNPIIYERAIPVFIDSDEKTFNMNPIALEKAFKKYINVKAVIVVDLYGQSADYDPIKELCEKYNVPLIEDSAESLGSTLKVKKAEL